MNKFIETILSSSKLSMGLLVVFLFFPLFFHGNHLGLPWVKGGDEPHFLILINSLLNDGDFDLRNNYDSALKGSDQAGRKYAGKPLDRHAYIRNAAGQLIGSNEIFEGPEKWPFDSNGYPIPLLKKGVPPDYLDLPEYSSHPLGMALLLAPILWIVRGTRYVEPMALFCSFLAVAMSAFLFRRLVGRYHRDPMAVNAAVLLVFLASPIWMNARTLYSESFLLFFALASYLWVVEKKSGFWPGILIGLGGLLKPYFLLMSLPVILFLWQERKRKDVLLSLIGPILSVFVFLYFNNLLLGSPFTSPEQSLVFGNPLKESIYLLLSWNHGILCFSPITVYCFFVWGKYFKERKPEAFLFGLAFVLYFAFMVCAWTGEWGWCFGPRRIVPVLPFLILPMVYFWDNYGKFKPWLRILINIAIVISLFINFFGALDGYWDNNPLTIFGGNIAP